MKDANDILLFTYYKYMVSYGSDVLALLQNCLNSPHTFINMLKAKKP